MGIIINNPISGQQLTELATYSYLYEPTLVYVEVEDDLTNKLYVDIELLDLETESVVKTYVKLGDYDLAFGSEGIELDLMKMIQIIQSSNLYKIGYFDEDSFLNVASQMVISKYKYRFKIYTDIEPSPTIYTKLPIIGERGFGGYVPSIISAQALTEAQLYGVDLKNRWKNYPILENFLETPIGDARTINNWEIETDGKEPCDGMLIWKSRYGGWCYWGFDLKEEKSNLSYNGNLKSSMFEVDSNGIHIPTNYTSIQSSYSITLKALDLETIELRVLNGINYSPAVYYVPNTDLKAELMRVGSVNAPLSSLADGGDFSITLESISTSSQKTR